MSPGAQRGGIRLAALTAASVVLAHSPASAGAMAAGLFTAGAAAMAATAAGSDRRRRVASGAGAAALLAVLIVAAHRDGLGRAQRAGYFLWLALLYLAFAFAPRSSPPPAPP